MRLQLEDPMLGVLPLDEAHGYIVMDTDRSAPESRGVVTDRVNANGTDDQTAFYGASSIALKLTIVPTLPEAEREAAVDLLRAFASPGRRPILIQDNGLTPARRLRLRGDQAGAPIEMPYVGQVQVQWKVPDGIVESAVEQVVSVPAVAAGEAGMTFPLRFPLVFPSIPVSGSVSVPNDGTEPAAPVLRLWGPCTDPTLVNVTTGQTLAFTGLSLTAEQYAEVDVREATARLNGRVTESLYGSIDLLASSFWWVRSGVNAVRYSPASFGPGAHADVIYRHTWI